jgi:thioredoxin 1
MFARRTFLLGAAVSLIPVAARAAPAQPFTAAAFEAAKKADKPILIDVTASWCPVCKVQKPILAKFLAQPRFAEMVAFEVDFDAQKDIVRGFGTRMQSTLIVFRGADELGRTVGDTQEKSIESLLAMAV